MSEQINNSVNEEAEIDLIKLITDLWERRKSIFKGVGVGILVGLIVAFSIPKEYTSTAKLVPEFQSAGASRYGSLGGLAMLAGMSSSSMGSGDAISANLYPEVVSSYPFISELFSLQVTSDDGEISTDLYSYMLDNQKAAWWSHIIALPFKALGAVLSLFKDEVEEASGAFDVERPTREQYRVYKALADRVLVSVDAKTYVISVDTKMQDPQIALEVQKVVLENIQRHVKNYRTRKVKDDLAYVEKMHEESEQKYYDAQSRYATFVDENKNISTARYGTELERLRNEMNLAYSVYSVLATNLEATKLKVQEQTPVYATLAPAARPTDDSEPNKPMILIAFTFLAGVISVGYLIIKDKLIEL